MNFCKLKATVRGLVILGVVSGASAGVIDLGVTPPDFMVTGIDTFDFLGWSLTTGDFNNDGVKDIAVGAESDDGPGNTRLNCGAVYVFWGGMLQDTWRLRDSLANLTIYGAQGNSPNWDYFGISLTVGDLNNDGIDDLIATSRKGRDKGLGQGSAHVFYGPLPSGIWDLAVTPSDVTIWPDDSTSLTNCAIGDLNNDGVDDLICGSAGRLHILYGGSLPPVWDFQITPSDVTIFEADTRDFFGDDFVVADFNDNGIDDLAVGASCADGPGEVRWYAGEVYVFYGGSLPAEWRLNTTPPDVLFYGIDSLDLMGCTLAADDINGDGIPDLVIGADGGDGPGNTRSDAGEVYVVYGGSWPGVWDFRFSPPDVVIYGASVASHFGGDYNGSGSDKVCSFWDLDHDGIKELIISCMAAPSLDTAAVYIFKGGFLPSAWDLAVTPATGMICAPRDTNDLGDIVNGINFGFTNDVASGLGPDTCPYIVVSALIRAPGGALFGVSVCEDILGVQEVSVLPGKRVKFSILGFDRVLLEADEPCWVSLALYDIAGRKPKTLWKGLLEKGEKFIPIGNILPGVYILVLTEGKNRQTRAFVRH